MEENIIDIEKVRSFSVKDFETRFIKYKNFLNYLGGIQKNLRTVIITGSTGKGSTAFYLSKILEFHKIKTGLFTSPHIIDVTERIKINGENISKKDLDLYKEKILREVENFNKKNNENYIPTFFELLTISAFLYFIEKKVDIAILEVGMGGRLDATNTTEPILNIITPICYDHTNFLGKTLKSIAKEKAEVIKKNSITIISKNERKVLKVITKKCKKENSKLFIEGKDFETKILKVESETIFFKLNEIDFSGDLLSLGAINSFSLAFFASRFILKEDLNLSLVKKVLNLRFPARFQIINYKDKKFIIDGAHNKSSAFSLVETLKLYNMKDIFLIFSILADKDIEGVLKKISELGDEILIFRLNHPREADILSLHNIAKKYFKKITILADLKKAIEIAFQSEKKYIIFTGSFYLCSEVLKNYAGKNYYRK